MQEENNARVVSQPSADRLDLPRPATSPLESLRETLCNVSQIFNGWRGDPCWSQFDEAVAKSVRELHATVEDANKPVQDRRTKENRRFWEAIDDVVSEHKQQISRQLIDGLVLVWRNRAEDIQRASDGETWLSQVTQILRCASELEEAQETAMRSGLERRSPNP